MSRRRLDLKDTVVNRQQRDIKRPPTKVEDQDVALTMRAFVKTVRNRSRRRFVDDPHHVQPRNQAASFVACRCESLKNSGHVMTVFSASSP